MIKEQKGITLIALVVTIVMLLILASVSLSMVFDSDGLFKKASKATIEYRAATVEEEVTIWKSDNLLKRYNNEEEMTKEELIDDQYARGLITDEEANTAKTTGKVTIGSKTISYLGEEAEIYAFLYEDGTLSIGNKNNPIADKTVKKEYGEISNRTDKPWAQNASEITTVIIKDKIKPNNINNWFNYCENLVEIQNLRYVDTSNVTNMNSMFSQCKSLTQVDLSNFNTSNVTSMWAMFYECVKLTDLDLSNFNTSKVTSMGAMFTYDGKLTNLDVSTFDTSNVTNMASMFAFCGSLTKADVSNFNTSKVTSMEAMFASCGKLTNLDVSKFDTSNVKNMRTMFQSCTKVTNLDVSKFVTSNVTSMEGMFRGCNGLTELDLSNFNTSNVKNMKDMFGFGYVGASRLTTIYIGDSWNTTNVTESSNMFLNCNKLVGGNGTVYDSNYIDKTYARVDTADTPGYFTRKQ